MPYPNLTLMHWVPLLAASATLLAVLVALFRESFFLWWRRPQLIATIRSGPPDCNKTQFRPASTASTVDSYVFRLWVTNIGRSTATRVQVFAAELRRQHAGGSFRREERFLPMNLLWSHIGVVFADGIAPHMASTAILGSCSSRRLPTRASIGLPGFHAGRLAFSLRRRCDRLQEARTSSRGLTAFRCV